ncbi:MAG: YdcF family protein [Thermoflexales bacterium]|nr:YdcF family protein [Thermoflexales bacterium]
MLAAGVLLWVTAGWWLPAIGRWLAVPARPGQADAVIVLGGSGPLAIRHGVELYHHIQAGELWYTGDGIAPEMTFSYGESFARFAVQQDVPAESIHLLATTSTWEDGQAIAGLARQRHVRSLLIVTNWSHSRRALCVIQQQLDGSGIELYYDPPRDLRYGPDDWWLQEDGLVAVVNELIKLVFYWRRYGLPLWRC